MMNTPKPFLSQNSCIKFPEEPKIYYQYLGDYDIRDGERRLGIDELAKNSSLKLNKIAAKYLDVKTISLLNFVIFDGEEVIARQPYEAGHEPTYVVMHGAPIAELFSGYFRRLWSEGKDASALKRFEQTGQKQTEQGVAAEPDRAGG